ncbi:hypothetical protein AVEN_199603-1 [Araneus ventricosus]|uniref:Uncharacterized protein n=1 Tax=Araneus ventricosus TaxID=182803 RepID=A0A4Y2QBQ7_ARAVE|nr:hypothetical protein AVEN_199603-1 [Araneus ventricosus]
MRPIPLSEESDRSRADLSCMPQRCGIPSRNPGRANAVRKTKLTRSSRSAPLGVWRATRCDDKDCEYLNVESKISRAYTLHTNLVNCFSAFEEAGRICDAVPLSSLPLETH